MILYITYVFRTIWIIWFCPHCMPHIQYIFLFLLSKVSCQGGYPYYLECFKYLGTCYYFLKRLGGSCKEIASLFLFSFPFPGEIVPLAQAGCYQHYVLVLGFTEICQNIRLVWKITPPDISQHRCFEKKTSYSPITFGHLCIHTIGFCTYANSFTESKMIIIVETSF